MRHSPIPILAPAMALATAIAYYQLSASVHELEIIVGHKAMRLVGEGTEG